MDPSLKSFIGSKYEGIKGRKSMSAIILISKFLRGRRKKILDALDNNTSEFNAPNENSQFFFFFSYFLTEKVPQI